MAVQKVYSLSDPDCPESLKESQRVATLALQTVDTHNLAVQVANPDTRAADKGTVAVYVGRSKLAVSAEAY